MGRYTKYQMVLRILYLKFQEIEKEMRHYKIECPGESVDCYLVQLCLINELIEVFNGTPFYITSNENFMSSKLDNYYSRQISKLCNNVFEEKRNVEHV